MSEVRLLRFGRAPSASLDRRFGLPLQPLSIQVFAGMEKLCPERATNGCDLPADGMPVLRDDRKPSHPRLAGPRKHVITTALNAT